MALLTRANTLKSHLTHGQLSLLAGGEFAAVAVAEVVAADGVASVVDIATAQWLASASATMMRKRE